MTSCEGNPGYSEFEPDERPEPPEEYAEGVQVMAEGEGFKASGFGGEFGADAFAEFANEFTSLGSALRWSGFKWVGGQYEFGGNN